MKAVLFPNLVEYPSMSMRRYAAELFTALRSAGGDGWEVQQSVCHHVELAAKLVPGPAGKQLAGRLGRLVKYPFHASRASGNVFHILDHSHAHLALGLDRRATVLTCHDLIPLLAARGEIAMSSSRLAGSAFALRLGCVARCAAVIADSESTRRDLIRFTRLPADRIRVIYLGVSRSFAPPAAPNSEARAARTQVCAQFGLPDDAKIVLHVGTGSRYKNVPALIRVWLVLAGAACFDDERLLIHELGLSERVVEAGAVYSDTELAWLYQGVDVLAFPSLWEGFGWPPLEAMACGTPVVVSNAASLPEVVGDAGLMVAPHDHYGLAQALEAVLSRDELHRSLAAKGLARARQFTWERTARQTLAVYQEVARECHRSHAEGGERR
jgi:glycosyltransferase involved in cell wall biosynthesis